MRTCLYIVFIYVQHVSADVVAMPRSGTVSSLWGYAGVAYQAIEYEPLCGTFGSDIYSFDLNISDTCVPAIEAYADVPDPFALYDATGIRIQDVGVGAGQDVCECFSLQSLGGKMADFCFWVTGAGRVTINNIIISAAFVQIIDPSAYRVASHKALPLCAGQDLQSLESQWSATRFNTAVQLSTSLSPSSNLELKTTTTLETKTTLEIQTSLKTQITVATQTTLKATTLTFTAYVTDTEGSATPSTSFITRTVTDTVFTTQTVSTVGAGEGVSSSDRIALGVGIGIGIPTMILMIILKYGKQIWNYFSGPQPVI